MVTVNCKACVVSSGAFTRNKEIMAKMQPKFYDDGDGVHVFTHLGCTGDGITMCEKIGADVDYYNKRAGMFGPMRHPFGTCSIAASGAAAFDVDRDGNLCALPFAMGEVSPLADVPGRFVWGIADEKSVAAAMERSKGRAPDVPGIDMDALYNNWRAELDTELSWETMYKADTLEELAAKLKVPAENLIKANADYEEFLKHQPEPQPGGFPMPPKQTLDEGPFYAIYKKMFHENALGGVVIDENTNVVRGGRPVPGLYATGDGTRGIMVPGAVGAGYIEGTISALTFALVSGFVAGTEAAEYTK